MIFVRIELHLRVILVQVRVQSVPGGDHQQAVALPDPLHSVLQVPSVVPDREQQEDRRFIRLGEDLLHHGFIAASAGGFRPVVHRVLNHHHIRISVRIRLRNTGKDIPSVPHPAEGGWRSAYAAVHQRHVRTAVRSVGFPEEPGKLAGPAFLIGGCRGPLRDRSAHCGDGDLFPGLRAGNHVLHPQVVSDSNC